MGYFANGCEGLDFEEHVCNRCVHSDYRDGKQIGDSDNPPCPVWMIHQDFNYSQHDAGQESVKSILDMLIKRDGSGGNNCRMFAAKD